MRPTSRTLTITLAITLLACLAGCSSAPIGMAPNLKGTYYEHALVTNPHGGGPQVVRWGPPDNYNPANNN